MARAVPLGSRWCGPDGLRRSAKELVVWTGRLGAVPLGSRWCGPDGLRRSAKSLAELDSRPTAIAKDSAAGLEPFCLATTSTAPSQIKRFWSHRPAATW